MTHNKRIHKSSGLDLTQQNDLSEVEEQEKV